MPAYQTLPPWCHLYFVSIRLSAHYHHRPGLRRCCLFWLWGQMVLRFTVTHPREWHSGTQAFARHSGVSWKDATRVPADSESPAHSKNWTKSVSAKQRVSVTGPDYRDEASTLIRPSLNPRRTAHVWPLNQLAHSSSLCSSAVQHTEFYQHRQPLRISRMMA